MRGWDRRQEFEDLVLEFLDSLYYFALLLTGEEHRAEDLVYKTYLRASHSPESFVYQSQYKVWLFRILRSIFMNEDPPEAKEVSNGGNVEEKDICYEPPEGKVDRAAIYTALNELPDQVKSVVMLHDVFGFDYKEITRILGCPAEQAISRLRNGRNLMKRSLKVCSQNVLLSGGR